MTDDSPVITLRKSTVVRIGIAVAVAAALGAGIAIGLLAGGSSTPTLHVSAASSHTHRSKTVPLATTTTTLPSTTTTVAPVTTTTVARPPVAPVTTTTVNRARAILSPATTPPVINECSVAITPSADGSPSPAFCQDGSINVLAWQDMAGTYPGILALGTNASESQVLETMCE
ncbi:MAG TPA: hypothetical protein VNG12_26005, partial [Acidimicrobiales bacterium]|nr:hypothetical protein [Acidimicrobiales bacterium]